MINVFNGRIARHLREDVGSKSRQGESEQSRLDDLPGRYCLGKAVFLVFPGPDSVTKKADYSRIGLID